MDLDFAIRGRQRLAEGLLRWRTSEAQGECRRWLDREARPACDGASGRGRPLCQRCRRQRPASRVQCISCARRVGPGCTPGCLLVELARFGRHRRGLCMDWPYCGNTTPENWVQGARDAFPTAGLLIPTPVSQPQGGAGGPTNRSTSSMVNTRPTAHVVWSLTVLQQTREWFQDLRESLIRRRGLGESFCFSSAAVASGIATWMYGLEPGFAALPAVPRSLSIRRLARLFAIGASTNEDAVCFCCDEENPQFHCEFCGQKYCEDCYDPWASRCEWPACRNRGRRALGLALGIRYRMGVVHAPRSPSETDLRSGSLTLLRSLWI